MQYMEKHKKKTFKELLKVRFNVKKAAYSVMIASWLQIVSSLVLAVLYFLGYSTSTSVMVLVLIPVIAIGNSLLMRNSWSVLSNQTEQVEMMQTMQGTSELNKKLRVQRHDFINHLQVVHSLIQLNEHDEAAKYIAQVYEDIRQVGKLLKTANPAVNGLLGAKQQQAIETGVALELHISARLENTLIEDWELCRVLSNLLDNALFVAKERGGVVHLSLREDINSIHFSVENDGNIDENIKNKIFDPGFTTKGEKGTGMGLYIVKETLDKYNGKIHIDSGTGTTRFHGYIPSSTKP